MPSKKAPSRKKSLGYYAKVNKKGGTGSKAGGGMTKKGSKAWKRRKSFCARSRSWTSERGKAARRKWNC